MSNRNFRGRYNGLLLLSATTSLRVDLYVVRPDDMLLMAVNVNPPPMYGDGGWQKIIIAGRRRSDNRRPLCGLVRATKAQWVIYMELRSKMIDLRISLNPIFDESLILFRISI